MSNKALKIYSNLSIKFTALVSTIDQNLDLHIEALQRAGCEKIFEVKISYSPKFRTKLDKIISINHQEMNALLGDLIDWLEV